ncbi:MAG: hypothetical protein QXH32_06795 [Candidatus Caldarchaeum sp.]
MVDEKFFDRINYSICDAISRTLGSEKAREIFRMMGRTHYAELKREGLIVTDGSPLAVLESIARYLENSGYMKKIVINKLGENEAIVDMYGVSVLDSSVRLTRENKQPSHIMTNTMVAAFEEKGYEVELVDLVFDVDSNHVREKWILKRKK